MEKYIAHEMVEAAPALCIGGEIYLKEAPIPLHDNDVTVQDGYKVVYEDGVESFCEKEYFERVARSANGMTFGMAIEAMKMGKKVCRRGWNGKGMYLWLLPAATLKKEWCRDERLLECFGESDELLALGSIRMYTHDSTGRVAVLTGWLASQSDMLAEDWKIVE